MRVDRYDTTVEAALAAARASGLYIILRMQTLLERRLVVARGSVERLRTSSLGGIGVHALTPDGSVGFASVDDIGPEAAVEAVRQAGALAEAARAFDAERTDAPFRLASMGRVRLDAPASVSVDASSGDHSVLQTAAVVAAQEALGGVGSAAGRTVRSTLHVVDEEWRIVRSDGTDVSFATPRASLRHDLTVRVAGTMARAGATVAGLDLSAILEEQAIHRLTVRTRRSAADAVLAAGAAPPRAGSYRIVLRHGLAKGLAHEAIGHLCESDVDGSVLMRGGRLRLGERLARETVSIVDGPVPGDFVQQPFSANGIPREQVALIEGGVLRAGLGDLFSAGQAGVEITGACRAASFRDRPTPRLTNIRIEVANAATLDGVPDDLTPDDVIRALGRLGLLDRAQPTIYLTGYRGGQAHPRRGDFVFAADAAYDLSAGGAPRGPASFSGLAERALASIVAGIGPLCTDAIGTCTKDGSGVSSSGGSHTLLVLDPDPDLIVTAAT